MHEFSSSSTKVNKAVTKVITIGNRLPLIMIGRFCYPSLQLLLFYEKKAKLMIVAWGGGGTWPTNIRGRAAGKSIKLPCPGVKFRK